MARRRPRERAVQCAWRATDARDVGGVVIRSPRVFQSWFRVLVLIGGVLVLARGQLLESSTVDSAAVAGSSAVRSQYQKAPPKGPFALILVVDAARSDEFDLSKMPNLAALMSHGARYTQGWVGQLPSVTESSHATIGTGVFPSRHLILGDTWRVPGTNQMSPNLLDGSLVHTGYIGKFIAATKVPSLAAFVRAKFPGSQVVALSGHKAYAADGMGAGSADFVAYGYKDSRGHFVPGGVPGRVPAPSILTSPQLDMPTYPRVPGVEDEWTTTLALKFLFKYHPRVMMVNLPEVDVFGHANGTDATVMQPLMQGVDHQIGRLVAAYQRAHMYDETYFMITSDHGMVPGVKTVQDAQINAIIKAAGGDPLYVGHGDSSEIWLKNTEKTPEVGLALATASIPNVAAVYVRKPDSGYMMMSQASSLADPEVPQAYDHLLSTFNSTEAPDIVLLYDENTMTMKPAFAQSGRKGDHGGATWGAQHIAFFLSGPGVKSGFASTYPAQLVDVAPTIETLMGIRPRGQDGVPLANSMVHPPTWAVTAQRAAGIKLTPLVAALAREAVLRPNQH